MAGATPVFADIEPDTFCLDPDAVSAAVTSRTAAVLPVHLYGHPAPWDGLSDLAERHGLLLLEDAAQAHGASYDGIPVGALGDIAAFSFYATKNMTTGEGGMVVCRDEDTARRVRLLRNQGMEQRYRNEIAGLNNRMTDLAAAIGRVQLRRLPELERANAGPSPRRTTSSWSAWSPRPQPPRPSRCGTSTPSAPPTATRWRPDSTRGASTARSTTRCRPTGSRRTTWTWSCPRPSGPPVRCCHCRSDPDSPLTRWSASWRPSTKGSSRG